MFGTFTRRVDAELKQMTAERITSRAYVLILVVICLCFEFVSTESAAPKRKIYVSVLAGRFDRSEAVVSFAFPPGLKRGSYVLEDESHKTIPLQIDSQRQASFVLPELGAGQTKKYQLVFGKQKQPAPATTAESAGNRVNLTVARRNVLSFVAKPTTLPNNQIKPIFLRGGYIHPVYSPSGRIVTDDYPPDHYHHHGIWFAWTKTEFEGGHPDFWNVGDGTGRIEFEALDGTWNGAVHSGFISRQRYIALTGSAEKTALNERWEVRAYAVGQTGRRFFMFDLVATQQCATGSPLVLEEYRYGGMGVRGHRDWKDKSKVAFLTSEGKTRVDGNATRARWCHLGGPVDGELVGIAILDHPANFRAPGPMRINPDDPFFNFAPSQLGKFEIKPSEQFVLRYRYVVADGAPDPRELDRLWNDFANPPRVTVEIK